ncbi:hypothetical protein [Micromonospora antibiotica]|uniref:Uncharacterized protein n=1 Tax=Micromonospora antibiotica TaxID=2807623 RepID=A0ABS3V8U5_9ACTN|nr:hypothetical protein [Micromonospora antibiotica]MBO4162035.1 hypothetical protein [Micromonospora antibiotica]
MSNTDLYILFVLVIDDARPQSPNCANANLEQNIPVVPANLLGRQAMLHAQQMPIN